MRRSIFTWTETLKKLGLKWKKQRLPKARINTRSHRHEQLEVRQLLAADLVSVEDNDSILTAQTAAFVVDTQYVIEGSVGDGTFASSDVDFYKVSLSAGQTFSVDLDANYLDDGTNLSWLDSYIRLFDSSGNQVAVDDNGESENDFYSYLDSYLSFTAVTSGDFYIGVSGYGNSGYDPATSGSGSSGSSGDYILQLLATDPIPPDAYGDQISTAESVSLTPSVLTEINGEVGDGAFESKDVDLFEVTLAAGERLSIDIDANYLDNGSNLSNLNSYLRVFNASGSQLAASNYGAGDNDFYSTGNDGYLSFLAPSAGTYYIGVSSYYNRYYSATVAGSGSTSTNSAATGDYRLQLFTEGAPTADAEGDDLTTAQTVSLTENVLTEIDAEIGDGLFPGKDIDLFQVTLQQGQALTIDIDANYLDTGGGWYSDLNSYLRLFDASGNELAENNYGYSANDYSGYNDSYLTFVAPTTGTFYIGVSSQYNPSYDPTTAGSGNDYTSYNSHGEYRLQLLASEPLPADSAGEELLGAQTVTLTENVTTEIDATIGDGWYQSADVDLYAVTLDAGDRLLVDIDANYLDDGTPDSSLNSYLRIFNASGSQISFNDNATSDSDDSSGSDSYLLFVAPSSGTFYIGVSSYYNRYYDSNSLGSGATSTSSSATGDYRLQLTDIGPPSPDSAGDDISSAQTVALTEDVSVEIDAEIGDGLYYSADVDMYAVTMTQGQRLAIDIDATRLDDGTWYSSLNSYLRLFDASGNSLLANDNDRSLNDYYDVGSDGYLWFVAPSAGTFYIGVSSYYNRYYDATTEGSGGTSTSTAAEGEYKLQLLLAPALPPDNPGEDIASAQTISLTPEVQVELDGSIGDGTYGSADVDLYAVTLAAGQTIRIDVDAVKLDGDGSSLSSLNSYVRMFDASGTQLSSNNNGTSSNDYSSSADSYLEFTAFSGGTYYIGVSSYYNRNYDPTTAGSGQTSTNAAAIGDYKLQLLAETPPEPDSAGEELSTAEVLELDPFVPVEIDAEIGDGAYFTSDVDLYAVTLTVGQTVTFDLDAYWDDEGNTISSLNGYLRLFDSAGNQLKSNSSGHSDNDHSQYYWGYHYFNYQDSFLTFTATAAGTYYLGVSSDYNTNYDPETTGTGQASSYTQASGAYKLQVLADGPAITVDDVSVGEDSSTVTFTVRLNPLSDETVTVDYATADGTALAGSDYTAISGTLTFAPGTATQTVTVAIADDGILEDPESFTLQLSNISSNATLLDSEATATIADAAGDELSRALDVSLTPEVQVELEGSIGDGTYGSADVDLYAVTLAAGQTIRIDVDAVKLDGDGSSLSSLNSYVRMFDASGTQLSYNNNGTSSNDYSSSADSYLEFTAFNGGTYYIGVSSYYGRNYDPTVAGSGQASTNAAAIGDYKLQLLAETPPAPDSAGEELSTAQVVELDPFVPVEIDATIGDGAYFTSDVDFYAVTLFEGQTVTFDIDAYWDDEGNTISSLNSYLRLFDSAGNQLQSNSSSHSDNDHSEYYWGYHYFNYQDSFLTFTALTAGTYYLGVSSDYNTNYDPEETGSGSTSTSNSASGAYKLQVLADGPALTVDDVFVGEDSSTVTFTVRLNPLSDETVTVDYATADGTALAGSDYTATSGTLTFAPGTATQTVTVAIADDGILEDPESFTLQLLNISSNATLLDSEATATIADAAGDELSRALDVSLTPEVAVELEGSIGDGTYGSADVDLYAVTLAAGQTIRIDIDALRLDGDGTALSSLNSYVRMFNSTGTQLSANDNGASPNDYSSSADSYLSFTAFSGGTYYIGVSSYYGRNYDPTTAGSGQTSTNAAAIGDYKLQLLTETPPTPDSAGEELSTAQVVELDPFVPVEIDAEIGDGAYFTSDVDLYAVTLTVGQTVTFDLDAYWDDEGNTISSLNGYLRLFDSAGNQLKSNSSGHSDNDYSQYYWGYHYFNYQDSFLTFTATTAGTYYLGVSSDYNTNYDPEATGSGQASSYTQASGAYKLQVLADGPALTVDDVFVGEDSSTVTFTVRLNPLSDETVTVDYATADGTALTGSDYTATSGTLTFAPGTATQTVTVTILDDGVLEDPESFTLQLSNISANATLLDSEATATIADAAGDELSRALDVSLTPEVAVELDGSIGDGTYGSADVDLYAVTLSAGQTIRIDVDAVKLDGDGTALSSLNSYVRMFNSTGTQLSANDNGASPNDYSSSADSYLSFTAFSGGTYYIGVSSYYGRNYDPTTAGSGQTSTSTAAVGAYKLQLLAETPPEPDSAGEELSTAEVLELDPFVPVEIDATIGDGAYFTSDVDFYAVTLFAGQTVTFDVDAYLLDSGTQLSPLDAHLRLFDAAGTLLLTNSYALSDNDNTGYNYRDPFLTFTATTAGTYYLGVSSAYNTSYDPEVTGSGQTSGYTESAGAYKLQVLADGPAITVDDVSVGEDSSTVTFTVRLNPLSDETVTIDYATADGTALAGSDYTTTSGTLTFAPGTATQTVTVAIADDGILEDPESFTLQLSNISANATLLDSEATATITPEPGDDFLSAQNVSITPGVTTELSGNIGDGSYGTADVDLYAVYLFEGQTLSIDIDAQQLDDGNQLSDLESYLRVFNDAGSQLRYSYDNLSPNDYASSDDAFISFLATTTGMYYIGVSSEYNRNYNSATLGSGQTSANADAIGDYKLQLTASERLLSVEDVKVGEDSSTVTFTVELDYASDEVVTVDFTTVDGTALAGSDYLTASGSLTFAAGTTSQVVTVTILDDGVLEDPESFTLQLSSPVGAALANSEATATIGDAAGDDLANALEIALTEGNWSTIDGEIGDGTYSASDVDIYQVTLEANHQLIIDIDAIYDDATGYVSGATLNSYIRIFDATGNQVTYNDNAQSDNDYQPSSGNDSYLSFVAITSGTYFIGVSSYYNHNYDPTSVNSGSTSSSSSAFGEYTLQLQDVGAVDPDALGEELTTAQEVELVDNQATELEAEIGDGHYLTTDVDLIKVTLAMGQTLTVDVDANYLDDGTTLSSLDSYLRIFDANGNQVAASNYGASTNDYSAGNDAYLSYVATAAGSYYIGISSNQNSNYDPTTIGSNTIAASTSVMGAYKLQLQTNTPPTPDVPGQSLASAQVVDLSDNQLHELTAEIGDSQYVSADADLYQVTLFQGQTLTIDTDANRLDDGSTLSSLKSYLRIFDDSGNQLLYNYNGTSGDDYSSSNDSYLEFIAPAAGIYYVGVSSEYNRNYNPVTGENGTYSSNSAALGQYKLQLQAKDRALTINDVQTGEDASTVTFTVTLNPTHSETVTVDYSTVDGTALAGSDYTATSGTLTFAPGVSTQTVTVTILDDGIVEDSESFSLLLSNAVNATIVDAEGIATIADAAGDVISRALEVTLAENVTVEVEGVIGDGTYGTADVDLYQVSLELGQDLLIDIDAYRDDSGNYLSPLNSFLRVFDASGNPLTSNNDASSENDYSTYSYGDSYLLFTAPAEGTYYIGVSSTYNQSYDVTAPGSGSSSTSSAAIGSYKLQLTAKGPMLRVADIVVDEDAGTATFTVTLHPADDETVTVDYATADGTAVAGSDYVATAGTLTFAAGETSKIVTVDILNDGIFENPESFTFSLSNAVHATIGDSAAVATIQSREIVSSIQGNVFADTNGAGTWDVGSEQGLENIEVHVIDLAGRILATTYTDAQGHYEFNLESWVRAPRIEVVAPQNMAPTSGAAGQGTPLSSNVSPISHQSAIIIDALASVDIGLVADSDGDGVADSLEAHYGLNVGTLDDRTADTDNDGLPDLVEQFDLGSDPTDSDTDGDGLSDLFENALAWDPDSVYAYADQDNDRLPDLLEWALFGSDVNNADADGDLLPDYEELVEFGSNPWLSDTDGDGVDDFIEFNLQFDPTSSDSDNDGTPDAEEQDAIDAIAGGSVPSGNVEEDEVRLRLTIGDNSGSHSERYKFFVGPSFVTNPVHGQVNSFNRTFGIDQTLEFRVEHVSSTLDNPDYDWDTNIAYIEGGGAIFYDPANIIPGYGDSGNYYWNQIVGQTGTLWTHQVKLSGPEPTDIFVANLDDDDDNGIPDYQDPKTDLADDDLIPVTLAAFDHLPVEASGYFTISASGGVKLWWNNNGTPEEISSGTQLDFREQHALYAEPLSAGEAVIEATFTLTDSTGLFTQLGELSDRITLTVAPNGPTAAEDSTTTEDEDPCNCDCSCSVGPPEKAPEPATGSKTNRQVSVDFKLSGYRPPGSIIAVDWYLDGGSTETIYYSTDELPQYGDVTVPFSHQFNVSEMGTGVYSYTATLRSDSFDAGLPSSTFTGQLTVSKQDSSLGNGGISDLGKITATANGAIIDLGDGDGKHFLANGDGTFSLADEPYSLLTQNSDGGYTLTNQADQTLEFDSNGRIQTLTEANGQTTTYSYADGDGDAVADEISEITNSFGETVAYSYTDGLLTSVTDIAGRVTSYTYDSENRIETVTSPDPDGLGALSPMVETYAYDSHGEIASVTAANGKTTQYIRDSHGNLTQKILPDGSSVYYDSYSSRGLASAGLGTIQNPAPLGQADDTWGSIVNGSGIVTYYATDSHGNITRTKDELGNITFYLRNAAGLVTKMIQPDPDGAGPLETPVYEYAYDSRGNLLTEILPDGSVRQWEYHATWNEPIKFTDANGNITLYAYDSNYALLLSETAIIGQIDDGNNLETDDLTTLYTYTSPPTIAFDPPQGLIASITEADGVVTEFEYDQYGNLTKTTYAVGTTDEAFTTATYDAAGNMLTETDELGNTTTYTYDSLDRVISITSSDPDGAGPLSATVISYAYNAFDLVAMETINGRTTSYTYDSDGRLSSITEEDPDDTGLLASPETSYTYDTDGNVLTVTDPLGNVTTYAYTDGLLTSVTGADPDDAGPLSAPVTSYTYNDNGQILTITDPLSRVTTYEYDNLGRQISVTYPDPDGGGALLSLSETTVYDLFGRVASRTDTAGVETSYTYDPEGNLLTETTPLGTTTYAYDELNRRVEIETADPDGGGALNALTTIYVYNAAGMLASVTTPVGTTTYAYDNRRRRTSVTQADPDGAGPQTAPVSSTTYDDAGNVLTETDALGNVTSYEYDALNRVVEITSPDPDGAGALTSPVTGYEYDEFGQLVSMTDPNGGVTTYVYDDLGRKIAEVSPDPDGGDALTAPEVSYAYDANGQLVSMTDPLGNETVYEYDNLGRQISVTLPDPDGVGAATSPVTTYVYDAAGQLSSMTDPLGRTTSYTYDALGRTLTETLPDPDDGGALTAPVTTYVYGADGRLASVEDAENQTVSYTYTASGQIATMTDPRGVTTYTYDALGRQLSITEPDPDDAGPLAAPVTTYVYNDDGQLESMSTLDGATSYEYDALGRTIKVTTPDPDGAGSLLAAWTVYSYDALGRTLSETDRLGHETSYDYDNLGRLILKTDAEGGETEYTYDANGNRLTLTDPEENTTTWTYDALNRMLTNTNELSDTRYYEYDSAGNLTEYIDRNGRVINYEYDNLQRRITENWLDGMSIVHTISYSYDAASQLIEASDSAATYTFIYDNLGRNTSTEHDLAALGFDVVIDEAYDALNRRISLAVEIDGSDDLESEYAYDYLNRMTQVTQAGQVGGNTVAEKRVDFTYDAEDKYQFTSITRYADLAGTETVATSTYSYDNADQLTSLTHVDGGSSSSTLAEYTYSYDEGNRLTGFTVYGYSAEDATYNYDDTDQLTGADRSGTTDDESYAYDENGNRIGGGYSTGDINQILSDGTYNYTYDDEGNRLTKTNISTGEVIEYSWDYRNRLTSIITKDSLSVVTHEVEYTYDAFNRRIVKSIDVDGAVSGTAVEEIYIYDGMREERGNAGDHMLLVFDEAGNLTNRFLYGPHVDQVLASEEVASTATAGDVLWVLTDNLGTVRDLAEYDAGTDATTIVNHFAYDAFGQVASETNSAVDFLFAFTGRERDEESSLQYSRARYYEAELGRWISADPLGFDAMDPNLYRYVGNSPSFAIDPSGLEIYLVDRPIGGWAPTHPLNPLDHTFIVVTDEKGNIIGTYSWGNGNDASNPSHWYQDQAYDVLAAILALQNGRAKIAGNDSMNPYVIEAFRLLSEAGSPSAHHHGGAILNCKTEAERLLKLAQEIMKAANSANPKKAIEELLYKYGLGDPPKIYLPEEPTWILK
ncbi:Calx-beta domain-containing protein [Blastopirellula marina]|uniref:Calx-beta domain-containing protein n=1 Tax=Blastopirellula marina DSM 3645 TaxID=314230 RepID=A3ZVF4_9BACT|nr:Calx-beta domain-containing protein [Blastopirellula marina]EAQ79300.1 hypothetical protein DSM3645_02453 [Blastopirellula marina DSM 3645]